MTIRGVAVLGAVLSVAVAGAASAQPDPGNEEVEQPGVQLGVPVGVHLGVHLSWVRDETAADCPDAAAIEEKVASRLGDNPFQRAPTQFIEAIVTRQTDTFQVTIAMRDGGGKLVGNRSIASTAGDCRSIATAAALTIAILIDPDALMRAVAPPPAPPPPPPAAPAGAKGRMTVLAEGAQGLLPGLTLGVALAATVNVARRVAIGVAGAFFPESRTSSPNPGFAFGVSYGQLIACVVPFTGEPSDDKQPSGDAQASSQASSQATSQSSSGLRWELCGGLSAGLLHVVVYAPTPLDPGQRWTFAAAQLTRLVIPIFGAGVLEVGAELSEPFPRRSFFVEGEPPGMDTVFTQPALAVKGFVGLGVRWR